MHRKKYIQAQVRILGQRMCAVSLWITKISNIYYCGLSSTWGFQTETGALMWDFLMCLGLPLFSFSLWQSSAGVWPLDSCFFLTVIQHCAGNIIITSLSALEPCGVNNGQHGVSVAVSYSWQSTQRRANWTMWVWLLCRRMEVRLAAGFAGKHQAPWFLSPVSPFIWGRDPKSFQKECKTWSD